jgi:hypothetical protein
MKWMLISLVLFTVSGCATTAAHLAEEKPAIVTHTDKTVSEYAGCIAPKFGATWPFVQTMPIEDGTRVYASGSMSIPKVIVVVDVTADQTGGATVAYKPKDAAAQGREARVVQSCI